jgi:ubiquinone biosynthesis protein
MKLSRSANRVKGIRRFSVITRVLVKHGLGDILDRIFFRDRAGGTGQEGKVLISKTVYPSAGRIRRVLEELGPSFIKLGQLMSTRADIFPPEYIQEFKKLQDRVPPIPYDQIKTIIEDDLTRPLDEIFESFAKKSLAAASVAQVHLAELKHGKKVAVKVIRPGIHKKIREDIRLMYYFAEKIENAFEIGRVIGAVNLVKEFERNIFRELDMSGTGHVHRGRQYRKIRRKF